MSVGERISQRRKELGLTVDEVAEKLDKNRATVYRYESDEIENLPITTLEPLAKILRVSPAYLMGWEKEKYQIKTKKVPILGEIAAGEPILAYEDLRTYIEVDENTKVDFCLKVKGDSMINTRIHDGDLVFVKKQPVVENGEIAVVLIDNEATLKRFYKNEVGIILKPENSKYQPRFYTEEDFKDVKVLGKAIFFQSRI